MSMQPPAAPHRVAIADIQIPFWRLVVIMVKWTLAAIPATIIIILVFALVSFVIGMLMQFMGWSGGLTNWLGRLQGI